MKVVAYILFVLQALSLYGNFAENGANFLPILLGSGLPYLLGYFLPAIIGVILLVKHSKKQEKKQQEGKQWECSYCHATNPAGALFCTDCGKRKV